MASTRIDMAALLTPDRARDWKPFVADYVSLMTRSKANRELVSGYRVKRAAGGYRILFADVDPGYGVMSAEAAYSWFARLPLGYFAREADNARAELLSANP